MSAMSREVKSSLREHECSQMCTCIYTLSSRGEKKNISGRQTHKMRVRHLHYYVATFIWQAGLIWKRQTEKKVFCNRIFKI